MFARRFAAVALLVLVAATASAQFFGTGSSPASSTPSGTSADYVTGNFTFVDGGIGKFVTLNATTVNATTANVNFVDAGIVTAPEVDFGTGGAINCKASGSSLLCTSGQFQTSSSIFSAGEIQTNTDVWAKGAAGVYLGSSGYPLMGNADGGSATNGGSRCEYSQSVLTANAVTVTFKNAFTVAPRCTCAHIAAAPLACGLSAAAGTTTAPFAVAAGTGSIDWICCGGN
jgi:hypothetical protein